MVSCDVDCVFDLSFEGFVLFSGGENLARSHFRNTNSQQKVGKPKQGIVKTDFSLPPRKNRIFSVLRCFLPPTTLLVFFFFFFLLSLLQDLLCI